MDLKDVLSNFKGNLWKEEGRAEGRAEGVLYGEKKKQEEMIRALNGVLPAETIAEKFQLSLEYVLEVLQEPMCVCEP